MGWRKSTDSGPWTDNCVEVNGDFRMSSACHSADCCVEIANAGDHVHVRDTKDRHGGTLCFTSSVWDDFITGIKSGDFA